MRGALHVTWVWLTVSALVLLPIAGAGEDPPGTPSGGDPARSASVARGQLVVFGDAEFVGDDLVAIARRLDGVASIDGFLWLLGWIEQLRLPADVRDLAPTSGAAAAEPVLAPATLRALAAAPAPVRLTVVWPGLDDPDGEAVLRRVVAAFAAVPGDPPTPRWIDATTEEGQREAEVLGVEATQFVEHTQYEFRASVRHAGLVVEVGEDRISIPGLWGGGALGLARLGARGVEREIAVEVVRHTGLTGKVGLVLPAQRFTTLRDVIGRLLGDAVRPAVDLTSPVPSDVAVLVVVAPEALPPAAATHLEAHLAGGGHVLLLLDPFRWDRLRAGTSGFSPSGLEAWLVTLGVRVEALVASDPEKPMACPVLVEGATGPSYSLVRLPGWPFGTVQGPWWVRAAGRGLSPDVAFHWPAALSLRRPERGGAVPAAAVLYATTANGYLAPPVLPDGSPPDVPPEHERRVVPWAVLVGPGVRPDETGD